MSLQGGCIKMALSAGSFVHRSVYSSILSHFQGLYNNGKPIRFTIWGGGPLLKIYVKFLTVKQLFSNMAFDLLWAVLPEIQQSYSTILLNKHRFERRLFYYFMAPDRTESWRREIAVQYLKFDRHIGGTKAMEPFDYFYNTTNLTFIPTA